MQKFIVTGDGVLKYGNVRMHKDLLADSDTCIGGGFYEFDYVENCLHLSGRSYDFGKPKWSFIDVLKLPAAFGGLSVDYEGEDLSLYLKIEYI